MARLTVKRIAGALGAEIGGVDLRELDDGTLAAIRAAWLEHLVVFFRDQPLAPAQYM
ncbi:MAG TPA: TauD/TfdA family dioxygenase, partial [Burkholderiales bacterium]|nr:TauD/TfdA family dioxygenase [Burkholderiales bacterium]